MIGQSDFQAERERERKKEENREIEKEREREEREIWRVRVLTENMLQYCTLMLSTRRDHSIDVLDNIY